MNKVSERVLLGGIGSGLLGLAFIAAGCSSDGATGGSAGTPSTAGANAVAGAAGLGTIPGGGASGAGTAGNTTTFGGASGSGTFGGATGTGTGGSSGGSSTAGNAGTAGAPAADVCPTDTNIVNTPSCWVGCDPALTTDNPQGVQGALYTFGDGTSCPATPADPVCAPTKGVCIAGTTKVDATYVAYGCAIGLELNSTGGTPSVKQPYTGPAKCFNYALTGDSGGNEVRISFTQLPDTAGKVSPYVSIPPFTNGKTGTVCTKDVSCQSQANCMAPGATPYDIQFEVVGGNHAGAYNVCLSSLTPVASGTSTLAQLCGAQGSANGTADVGKYFVQNNLFPGGGNKICVTPKAAGAGAGFTVDSAMFATGANLNAYPSVVDGWHYGRVSSDTALPKKMSAVTSVNSVVSYAGSDSKYDAAYDIWVLPTLPSAAVMTPAGGLEIMIWLNHTNPPNPAGGQGGTYMGYNVWTGTVQNWNYVAYEKTGATSFNGDLLPFIKDAISRKGTQTAAADPYLAGIEFGFEFYDYPGTGFAVTSFTSDVK
jgi:hypothetical protein